jgi:hypothetical protein
VRETSTKQRGAHYPSGMVRNPKDLDRLANELATLNAEERAMVLALASRRGSLRRPPAGFVAPSLKGGTWIAGDLHREDLYGDHGR